MKKLLIMSLLLASSMLQAQKMNMCTYAKEEVRFWCAGRTPDECNN